MDTPQQPPHQPQQNPLLARIQIPGESFTLPSRSLFYNSGEVTPTCRDTGVVHVYPMKTIDEIIMRSPDKVFSGDAVTEVFSRCIPDILQPRELLQKDVDFLVVALRKVSYGPESAVTHTHSCDDVPHEYNINIGTILNKAKALDPTQVVGRFTVKVGNGQLVKIEPIRYKDVIRLMQGMLEDVDPEVQQLMLLDSLCDIITAVDEFSDKPLIKEWLHSIPVMWANQISAVIDDTSKWGPDYQIHVECKGCNESIEVEAPLNPISFFT